MATVCDMDSRQVKGIARILRASQANDCFSSLGKKFPEKVFYTGSLYSSYGTTLLIMEDDRIARFVTLATGLSQFVKRNHA